MRKGKAGALGRSGEQWSVRHVGVRETDVPVLDDEQARGLRLLLLRKGAVVAHRFERSLTAELDETER